ncbi:MAG: haloacid dehalogenase-like hydrolase [Ignavibacteria bacterium]|nr:haloacid dehalogenase-like hydrolase [Ignavibacteria bacterium]MBT8390968.1 haloacid dehalogenase-like hydrolase [Ignavibacteria bacterium]NNJ52702.1 haloacid dehalogenase-like hydrolase [Ignavibacteriaceae bacterium]NNL21559.1 haloacid dehalogenase-like hydrolase [Ignavibacteriaceae bacterium]
MKSSLYFIILLSVIVLFSCNKELDTISDPLPSWNEGTAKQSIIDFVNNVTNEASPNFVKPEDRIATFDNDGTLWSEQPYYFQFQFAFDRVKEMAADHPEWNDNLLFKAALENDMETVMKSGMKGLMEIVMTTHAGMTTEEFGQIVKEWINKAKHPKTNKLYKEMVFQPMLELLDYLRANGFKTYIVSGGGIEFMRPWTEEIYGIPAEQVIGSSIKLKFEVRDGQPVLLKLPELDFFDDKEGKPVAINKFIGKRPIAAFGNSDGDLQMLKWTAAGDGKRLLLYVHHTDADREWAYDRKSHIGGLDKGLDEAEEKGWTVVDMKNDWKVIYPYELNK